VGRECEVEMRKSVELFCILCFLQISSFTCLLYLPIYRLKCADVKHSIEKKELIEGFGFERRRFQMRFVFFYFYCFNWIV
jgi:hypothetical protein